MNKDKTAIINVGEANCVAGTNCLQAVAVAKKW